MFWCKSSNNAGLIFARRCAWHGRNSFNDWHEPQATCDMWIFDSFHHFLPTTASPQRQTLYFSNRCLQTDLSKFHQTEFVRLKVIKFVVLNSRILFSYFYVEHELSGLLSRLLLQNLSKMNSHHWTHMCTYILQKQYTDQRCLKPLNSIFPRAKVQQALVGPK